MPTPLLAVTPPSLASKTLGCVLIIDDEASVRTVVAQQFLRIGYTTQLASDGIEGIAMLQQGIPDLVLILVDHMMPFTSGDQVAVQARQVVPNIPIIAMSGYGYDDLHITDSPFDAFLQKPFRLLCLQKTLSELFQD